MDHQISVEPNMGTDTEFLPRFSNCEAGMIGFCFFDARAGTPAGGVPKFGVPKFGVSPWILLFRVPKFGVSP